MQTFDALFITLTITGAGLTVLGLAGLIAHFLIEPIIKRRRGMATRIRSRDELMDEYLETVDRR